MDSTTKMLVALLAKVAALHDPVRTTRETLAMASAIHERRREYQRHGLPFVGGGSGADRQAHSRELAQARDAGWITTTGRTRPSVKLTDAADDHLRAMTGCYRAAESWPLLKLVAKLTDAGQVNAGHVLEVDLLATSCAQATSKGLGKLELQALPLLVRGWLVANSDTERRLGYAITKAGRQALETGEPKAGELPQYSREAADYYDDAFKQALAERETWKCESGLIAIPLSAGSWPEVNA